tara:strand:- start:289 stop:597 length:309 start_codon:yes stop_codon:yes gene_type:complete
MMTDHYEVEGSDERWCPQCVTKQRTLDKRRSNKIKRLEVQKANKAKKDAEDAKYLEQAKEMSKRMMMNGGKPPVDSSGRRNIAWTGFSNVPKTGQVHRRQGC